MLKVAGLSHSSWFAASLWSAALNEASTVVGFSTVIILETTSLIGPLKISDSKTSRFLEVTFTSKNIYSFVTEFSNVMVKLQTPSLYVSIFTF